MIKYLFIVHLIILVVNNRKTFILKKLKTDSYNIY